jgi:hypothetical protein
MSQFLENIKKENIERKGEEGENEASKKYKNSFVLKDNIENALNKMQKDAYNDSNKKIPPGFEDFARSDMFKDLLQSMLDYNRELFRLENK